ncbi:DUF1254 domain-containing protein [Hyphococcus sp.]|uniref:DUF1254 domain-containing protein n=1 Tax=Hyphococcus sp. TaxID=2038636 RepID=UPI0035C6A1AF
MLLLSQGACAGARAEEDGPTLTVRTSLIATDGYIFGFPILLMDETRRAASEVPYLCGLGGPLNAFTHKFSIPDPDFKAVVRPNVDTLYSSAFLDLSDGPLVLETPEVKDRFYLMAMLDAWTNNFAGPGTQSNGGEETTYLIAGPDWKGRTPAGMERIDAPSNLVWIIGRTELKGSDDLGAANAVQRKYKLYPLAGPAPLRSDEPCRPVGGQPVPEDTVRALSGVDFFSRLNELIELYPPAPQDKGKMKKLALINVGPEAKGRVADLSASNKKALDSGIERGQKVLDRAFDFGNRGAWAPDPTKVPLGEYGDAYLVRAIVSQIGFGANRNEFAVYQNAKKTGGGKMLDGSTGEYELRFADGATPPVNGFWSVTVYDKDGFLSVNRINRYALGSNSNLRADENGDIVISFATKKPDDVPAENWLPVPAGPFEVTLRMYWPREDILEGGWSVPDIVRR